MAREASNLGISLHEIVPFDEETRKGTLARSIQHVVFPDACGVSPSHHDIGWIEASIMRKLTLFAFCLALFFGQAPSGYASDLSKFRRLVVFGDSLSDNGNSLFLFSVPQPPY